MRLEEPDRARLLSRGAYEVYAPCMYIPSYEKYTAMMEGLLHDAACRVFMCLEGGEMCGIIALELMPDGSAEIRGIAVREDMRHRGIGSFMVRGAVREVNVRSLTAETDDDAVGFYRQSGFSVSRFMRHFDDGDVIRYKCVLTVYASAPVNS